MRALMKREGLTTEGLAEMMGMHRNGVNRIIRLGRTTIETLAQLCDALRCNPMDLIVWEDYPPVDPNLVAPDILLSRLGLARGAVLAAR